MSHQETQTIQTTEALPESPNKMDSTWTSFVPMILIFGVFYFLLIRPQEKKRKEHEALVTSVKRGEEVITSSGIFGKVVKVNDSDSTVILEIADNTSIKIMKSAIADIVSRKTAEVKSEVKDESKEEVKKIKNKEEKKK